MNIKLEPLLGYKLFKADKSPTQFAQSDGIFWTLDGAALSGVQLSNTIASTVARGDCVLAWHCYGPACNSEAVKDACYRSRAAGVDVTSGMCPSCLALFMKEIEKL
jgi:hypothetical protein